MGGASKLPAVDEPGFFPEPPHPAPIPSRRAAHTLARHCRLAVATLRESASLRVCERHRRVRESARVCERLRARRTLRESASAPRGACGARWASLRVASVDSLRRSLRARRRAPSVTVALLYERARVRSERGQRITRIRSQSFAPVRSPSQSCAVTRRAAPFGVRSGEMPSKSIRIRRRRLQPR